MARIESMDGKSRRMSIKIILAGIVLLPRIPTRPWKKPEKANELNDIAKVHDEEMAFFR